MKQSENDALGKIVWVGARNDNYFVMMNEKGYKLTVTYKDSSKQPLEIPSIATYDDQVQRTTFPGYKDPDTGESLYFFDIKEINIAPVA